MKKRLKIFVDIAMFFLMVYLLGYQEGSGLLRHGIMGCGLFALFFLHHILNLSWYTGLKRGRYPLGRVLLVAIDGLLLAAMTVMAVSAVMMSGDVFAASPFTVTQTGRNLHNLGTSWESVLMGVHLGFHTRGMFGKLYRRMKETVFAYVYDLLFGLTLIAGLYSFWKSGLWGHMLLLTFEAPSFDPLRFYGECVMTTVAACQIVWLVPVLWRKTLRRS